MKIRTLLISSLMVLSVSAFAQDLGTQVSDLQQQNRTVADAAAREYAEVSRRGKARIDQLENRIKSDQKELEAAKKGLKESTDKVKTAQANLKLRKEALKLQKKAYGTDKSYKDAYDQMNSEIKTIQDDIKNEKALQKKLKADSKK